MKRYKNSRRGAQKRIVIHVLRRVGEAQCIAVHTPCTVLQKELKNLVHIVGGIKT